MVPVNSESSAVSSTHHASLAVSCHNLHLAYDSHHPILNDLNLQVDAGSIVSLLGPSGCGKSTLLKAVAGLLHPQQGSLQLAHPTSANSHSANSTSHLAFVFQEPSLLPWRTVAQNIQLPLELLGEVNRETPAKVDSLMQLVGLQSSDRHKLPRQLSGGMKMRTSIARALITDPQLLLLDEPFAALDDILRSRMHDLLMQLWSSRRITILFVTHNIAEAVYLSHRIAIMKRGKIAQSISIPLPFPRQLTMRGSPEFAACYQDVSMRLGEE